MNATLQGRGPSSTTALRELGTRAIRALWKCFGANAGKDLVEDELGVLEGNLIGKFASAFRADENEIEVAVRRRDNCVHELASVVSRLCVFSKRTTARHMSYVVFRRTCIALFQLDLTCRLLHHLSIYSK